MDFYKIKKSTKDALKYQLFELKKCFDKFNNGRLSKKSIGCIIRSIHFSAPLNIMFLFLFASKTMCNFLLLYLVIVLIAFFIFDGCFITIIEKEYCEDDFTIIDPALELIDIQKTNKNRFIMSIPIGLVFIFTTLSIYIARFHKI